MERRIFGIENEYGVTCTFRGQRRLSPDEVARYLFRRVVHWGRSSNVFLENGARLYLDVGSHPEYATPECDLIREVVAHDKAGERILEHLLAAAELRLHEEGIAGDVYLFKNNTDSAGNSYGCHENYLVARHGEFARMADVLIPFFVTRQIWCGAGKVLHGPRGAQYCIAQRAEHIWEGVSSATTRSRPIINTRDEPHADAERYRRLHVIVGRLEHERVDHLHEGRHHRPRAADGRGQHRDARPVPGEPDPGDPGDQPRHDVHAHREARERPGTLGPRAPDRVPREDGAVHRAPRRRRHLDARCSTSGATALDALRAGEPERLVRKVDWVTKRVMIERYMAKHDLPLGSPRIALLDLAYHDVNRDRGLFYLLDRSGAVDRVVTDEEIEIAMRQPPQTTRAKLRGDFIRQAKAKRRDYTVDWVHLKLNDQAQRTVLCKDPFRSADERVEQLIAHM